jgi:hypothetical protein
MHVACCMLHCTLYGTPRLTSASDAAECMLHVALCIVRCVVASAYLRIGRRRARPSGPSFGFLQRHRTQWFAPETKGAHPAASALRLGSPRNLCTAIGLTPQPLHCDWAHPSPHLHCDWARPSPHLHCDRAHPATSALRPGSPRNLCTATGLTPRHICTATGLAPRHICTATGLTPQPLHCDWAHPSPTRARHMTRSVATSRALSQRCNQTVVCRNTFVATRR